MTFIIGPWQQQQQQHRNNNSNRQQKFIHSGTTEKAHKPKRNLKTAHCENKATTPSTGEQGRKSGKRINKRDSVRLKQAISIKRWKSKSLKRTFFSVGYEVFMGSPNHGSCWIMCMTFHERFGFLSPFHSKPQSANFAATKQQFKFHTNAKSLTVANELIILPSLSMCYAFIWWRQIIIFAKHTFQRKHFSLRFARLPCSQSKDPIHTLHCIFTHLLM